MKNWITIAGVLLGGCGSIHGEVRDAATGRPIGSATVAIDNLGWGYRDGDLVWDAVTTTRAATDAQGRFKLPVSGGLRLRSTAAGYPAVDHQSPCPRSPTLVRMGGPWPSLATNRNLYFADALLPGDADPPFPPALAKDYGVSMTGSALADGSELVIRATGGAQFVPGVGAIPPAPPLPYPRSVRLDFRRDCGWVFISNGARPVAVINASHPGSMQDPGGPVRWFMAFTELPAG